MSEPNSNTEAQTTAGENSRGERLRLAREAQGLEAAEVAARLYFETRFIHALENDDYSVFAGSAYLYGYMRAYVRLLGLPEDEFLRDLNILEDEQEPRFEHIDYQPAATEGNKPAWRPLAIAASLLLVTAIAAGLYLFRADEQAVPADVATADGAQKQLALQLPATPAAPAEAKPDSMPDAAATAQAEPGQPATVAAIAPAGNPAREKAGTEKLPRLLLEYKSDSWTDIRDADGKRLVYRMVEKGNRLELDSSRHYSVLLGYSPGVSVSWNDKPFNLSAYERENIAYFEVGVNDNQPAAASGAPE